MRTPMMLEKVRPTPPPSVLRGPADPDHFRVQVGRFGERWYADTLPACPLAGTTDATWPSVTTVKKASGADWTLVGLRRVAEHLERRPNALDGLTFDERYDALKSMNKNGLSAAGERGTNVHLIAEAALYGVPDTVADDAPGANYRQAVEAFFADHRPELVAAEFVAVHRDLNGTGYAGTCDALVRIDGRTLILDWKSRGEDSQHGAYPEEAAQIAAYARAQYMIVEGPDGPERRALPHIDGGLIVSIKPDGYRCYPIDLDAAAAHWTALHGWWCARRTERDAVGRQWPARKTAAPPRTAEQPGDTAGDPATPAVSPAPTRADELLAVRGTPDEGGAGDPTSFAALETAYAALDSELRAWIGALTTQAQQAGVPFHAKTTKSARRFDIIAALVRLARNGEADDETVRALLEPIIGAPAQFPSVTVGALIGSLSATEAAQFAALVRGDLAIVVREDGTPALQPAA